MQTETSLQEPQEHIFTVEDLNRYDYASKGQRFLNYLIDNLLMRYGMSYVTGTLIGYFLGSAFPEFANEIFYNTSQFTLLVLGYVVAIFNYVIYYTTCEKLFKGYTLGKLITGTRAVREDGQELTFRDAFMRSLIRIIPFEAFSGLGETPWHDGWTKTMVIKSR